jgi:hypothetical protein
LTTRLEAAFPEALVEGFDSIIPVMQNQEKDRHVLAAAVKAGAQTIVTFNLKHFPEGVLERLGIEAQPPDEFLIHQYHLSPESVTHRLHAQAQLVRRTLPELLATLAQSAPGFASMVRDALSIGATTPDIGKGLAALEAVRVKKR